MLALHDASCEAVMLNFVPQDAGNTGVVAVSEKHGKSDSVQLYEHYEQHNSTPNIALHRCQNNVII